MPGIGFLFVGDNLSFRSELLVKKKHTRYGEVRFNNAIAGAVTNLGQFKAVEAHRIQQLQHAQVTEAQASLCVLKAVERGIISAPVIPRLWREILQPSFDYGGPLPATTLTLWRVLNAFTTVLSDRANRSPADYAGQTMRINALLLPHEPELGQAA